MSLKEDEFSSLIALAKQLHDYNMSKEEDLKNAGKAQGQYQDY